jgi:hypothetical protein
MLPMTNATLTTVTAGGTAPDYDSDGTLGDPRWTGSEGVYVTGVGRDDQAQQVTQVEAAGDVTQVMVTRVELRYWPVGQLVQQGDTLTFSFEGAIQERIVEDLVRTPALGRVRAVVRRG